MTPRAWLPWHSPLGPEYDREPPDDAPTDPETLADMSVDWLEALAASVEDEDA